jgi:hypothetical protein
VKVLWVAGAALMAVGCAKSPGMAGLAALLFTIAGVLQLTGGSDLARSGRLKIARYPVCWDVPLAFFVRHRGQGLLFYRAFEEKAGECELPQQYFVIALPGDVDESDLRFTQFVPPEGSRLVGAVPLEALRADLSAGEYVAAAPLAALSDRPA